MRLQERVAEEIKIYVSNKPEEKKKSLREKYLKVNLFWRLPRNVFPVSGHS